MSDFNDRGRPVKRKREDWMDSGPGHRDNGKTSNAVNHSSSRRRPWYRHSPRKRCRKMRRSLPLARPPKQAARLVALYRRLWKSYVGQHSESSRLKKENSQFQVAHACLVGENTQLNRRCRAEEARSCDFREVMQELREDVLEVFEKWEDPQMTETPVAGGTAKPTLANENVAVVVPAVHFQGDQGTSASK
ncbi:hypothetical protein AnigIFM63604_004919 [Aspergillus niger]|uniref:Uncharacterized protein n=1 Tax=Aspergillus niger TaxID=5061 RepID=A0A9W6AAP5_ASPNG|nr:hypothetical protein AnigIFM63604_004919 [Aspergillus niger]